MAPFPLAQFGIRETGGGTGTLRDLGRPEEGAHPLVQAHQIADEAELAVRQSFERMEVIIHMDPISVLTKEQQGTHPEQQ